MSIALRFVKAGALQIFFDLNGNVGRKLRGHERKCGKEDVVGTKVRQDFFSERVVDGWNALQGKVLQSETIDLFKTNLRGARNECPQIL